MKTIAGIAEMKAITGELKSAGKSIGLVPTMGFLHEGHLSLVRESLRRADVTVVSLFVNPTQFAPNEDFEDYPRDRVRDSQILDAEGVDYLFAPVNEEMYPDGYHTCVEVQELQDRLCGRTRPGHFRGVCTVVTKLFNIVRPDFAFFGQKDAQQAFILKRMVRDLNMDTTIEVLPTVRDADGLALSSRNTYLDSEQRKVALVLSASLKRALEMVEKGEKDAAVISRGIREQILSQPLARIDYVEIVDIDTLLPLKKITHRALIALAVFIGKVRLIDNVIVEVQE